jgi:transposase
VTDISPDGSRLLLPVCGISYFNIIHAACECSTIVATAKRLGVGESTLQQCITKHHLSHWFTTPEGPRNPSKLTHRRLLYWSRQGMTRRDIAAEIGCSYDHLNKHLRRHGLTESLPNKGAASWLARRGIAEQLEG